MKRTLIVLLAALAVLAGILLKKRSEEKSMRGDAFVLDSARIADVKTVRVVGKKPDTSTLQLKDGKWVVARDGFPVDTSKVNKILKSVFGLQNKEVVSRNPARYSEYGLDSVESKQVTFSDQGGGAIADVVIGKTSGADYSSTYWRWAGKPEVFRTPGNFAWEIGTKEDDWKDKKLTQALAKDLQTIETTWKDSTGAPYHYKLEATSDSTWKMLEPQDSNRVKKAAASEMASRFTEMSIDEFVSPTDTNLSKVNIDSPMVAVKVTLKNGSSVQLKAGKTIAGYAYTQHPTRKELIKLSAWRFDAFKKKPFELLDAPKADSTKADSGKSAAISATAHPSAHAVPGNSGIKIVNSPKAPASPAPATKAPTVPTPAPTKPVLIPKADSAQAKPQAK